MKQYCRYCAFCIEGDAYYCEERETVLSDSMIKRANSCINYAYCGLDIITGGEHVERRVNNKSDNGSEQIQMELSE